ncbi:anion permease [Alistipes sp. OttesenSCG-928-B03]|nr:anion permease [Alistipes sp. OttesenSCG-928-B03]
MDLSAVLTPFNLTLATLAVAAFFFMQGKVRSDLVALCALLALMLMEILEPGEGLAGFSSTVVIMMIGLFVVGAGIFRTGLAKMISSRILRLAGNNENKLFILVMLVTAFVGAFVSNTGTVAVMMPIVISMAAGAGISARRYLMPMAFASGMGMFTLISTPPNLVIQEELIKQGYEPLKFFSFAPVGFTAVVVGIVVLFWLSKKLKPKNDEKQKKNSSKSLSQLVEEYNLSQQVYKVGVPDGSPIIGRPLSDLKIATEYNISIGKIVRRPSGSKFIKSAPIEEVAGPKTVINAGDMLFCHGSEDKMEHFMSNNGLVREKMQKNEVVQNFAEYGIAEVFIMPNSSLINHTVRDSRFRELYNVNVLGIKRQGDYQIGELKDARLHSGDALLIQGPWDDIMALGEYQEDMVLVGQPQKEAQKVTLDRKAPVAGVIMLLMIAVMVLDIVPAVVAVMVAAILMVATGCIRNMEEAYASINWSSVVLIGAMIPMATAFDKTGITAAISGGLLDTLGQAGPQVVLIGIYLATSVLTMFLSNTATAILFTPIAMQAAIDLNVSPYPFLFAVSVAASMCFASPFSTPPNALVMSAGRYTFMDYIRIGLPLQLIMGVVMVFVLPLFFPF